MMAARKYKQFSLEDRVRIEEGLKRRESLRTIATTLHCSSSSISREVRRNLTTKPARRRGSYGAARNCVLSDTCTKVKICGKNSLCFARPCKKCHAEYCPDICEDYQERICPEFKYKTSVCNGCAKTKYCTFAKRYYYASLAHNKYLIRSYEAKSGVHTTEADFSLMCTSIAEGLEKKKSLHQIFSENPSFYCSERNLYRLIHKEATYPHIVLINLPKAVTYKPRDIQVRTPAFCVPDRSYSDFLALSEFEKKFHVEMDTVEGCKGSHKAILTLYIPIWKYLFGFLLEEKTQEAVCRALDTLEKRIGQKCFYDYFSVCLTDRGVEFSDYLSLERSRCDGETRRMHLYYCDPRRSDQKGSIEKAHVELRKIFPKGTSFDQLTQSVLESALAHINSQVRLSLNDRMPVDNMLENFPKGPLQRLGIKKIPADKLDLRAWKAPRG